MIRKSVYLKKSQERFLKRLSKKNGVSESKTLRRILDLYLPAFAQKQIPLVDFRYN